MSEKEKKEVILSIRNISKRFTSKGVCVRAVTNVSFDVHKGETIGIVGESGCGKTTLGRCIVRAIEATEGQVIYKGRDGREYDFLKLDKRQMKGVRKEIQMIFQDPYSSLDPRMTVIDIIAEPIRANYPKMPRREREEMVMRIAEKVGLNTTYLKRYPHAFSGGQRQRIGTARALILKPQEMDLTYIFISHDLSVVEHISDKVGVMYLGRLVEFAETEALFSHPLHPYTEALLSAVPVADPDVKNERIPLEGEIPNPANPPSGCYFHERCRYCQQRCVDEAPELTEVAPGRQVACHFAGELHLRGFDYEKE